MPELSEPPRVTVDISGGIADVRLNRPSKLNAIDGALIDALGAIGEDLADNRGVRAVVLSGKGRAFCAGLDFKAFEAMAGDDHAAARGDLGTVPDGRITNRGQHAVWVWSQVPVPVIAAVHGVAFGGGLQIALGADLRIVSPDVELSVLEVRWGLIPDATGTHLLPRLVGLDVAKQLTWTGRIVNGLEAVRLGLATRTADDPREEALALAATIAAANPDAIRAAKRLLSTSLSQSAAEQLLDEGRAARRLMGSANQAEAVRAYFEKRSPVYSDPATDDSPEGADNREAAPTSG